MRVMCCSKVCFVVYFYLHVWGLSQIQTFVEVYASARRNNERTILENTVGKPLENDLL